MSNLRERQVFDVSSRSSRNVSVGNERFIPHPQPNISSAGVSIKYTTLVAIANVAVQTGRGTSLAMISKYVVHEKSKVNLFNKSLRTFYVVRYIG